MSLNLKKIITSFKKYHYFIMNKGKITLLSSDNSNTTAKNNSSKKLKTVNADNIKVYRIKLSKSTNLKNVLLDLDESIPLYIEIREYDFKNNNIKPGNEKPDINVFIKKKYLIKGIKMKDLKSEVKLYIRNKLSGVYTKLNYIA